MTKFQSLLLFCLLLTFFTWDGKKGFIQQACGQTPNLVLPYAHVQSITALAYSPDGNFMISGDAGGEIKIWDLRNGIQARTIAAHAESIDHLSFSGDRVFVSGGKDGLVKGWDLTTGRLLKSGGGMGKPIQVVGHDTAKSRLLVRQYEMLEIWDSHTLRPTGGATSLKGVNALLSSSHEEKIFCSPDLRYLAVGVESRLTVYDTHKQSVVYTADKIGSSGIAGVAFSDDGKYLALNFYQSTEVNLIDLSSGGMLRTISPPESEFKPDYWLGHYLPALTFLHDDSNILITAGNDTRIRTWDIRTGREMSNYLPPAYSKPKDRPILAGVALLAVAPNDRYFVSAADTDLRVWSVRGLMQRADLRIAPPGTFRMAVIHPDCKRVSTAYADGSIHTFDAQTGALSADAIPGNGEGVAALKLLDERRLAVKRTNGNWAIYDWKNAEKVREIRSQKIGEIRALSANTIITAVDSQLQVVQLDSDEVLFTIPTYTGGAQVVALSPDGRYLAFSGSTRLPEDDQNEPLRTGLRIWSLMERKLVNELVLDGSSPINGLQFSADGNRLLLTEGHSFATVRFIDVQSVSFIGHFTLVGQSPLEFTSVGKKGRVEFMQLLERRPPPGTNDGYPLLRVSEETLSRQSSYRKVPPPENIAALHPPEVQLVVGFEEGGVMVYQFELTLLQVSGPSLVRPYPYAPFHPWYEKGEVRLFNLHENTVLDARLPDGQDAVLSIGRDGMLRMSGFIADEADIPSLVQWRHNVAISTMAVGKGKPSVLLGKADGSVWSWNVLARQPLRQTQVHAEQITSIGLSDDGSYAAYSDAKGNVIAGTPAGDHLKTMDNQGSYVGTHYGYKWLIFSADSRHLLGYSDWYVKVWDPASGKKLAEWFVGADVSDIGFSADGSQVHVAIREHEYNQRQADLVVFDALTGEAVDSLFDQGAEVHSLAVDDQGASLVWMIDKNRMTAHRVAPGFPIALRLDRPPGPLETVALLENGKKVLAVTGARAFLVHKRTGRRTELPKQAIDRLMEYNMFKDGLIISEGDSVLQIESGQIFIIDPATNRSVTRPLPSAIELRPFNDSLLLLLNEQNELVWYDLKRAQPLVTLYLPGKEDFIAFTGAGQYYASKGAAQAVGFSTDAGVFGYEQFDLTYNRPDRLLTALSGSDTALAAVYYQAYRKRLKRLGLSEPAATAAKASPPELVVSTLDRLLVQEPSFAFTVRAADAAGPLNRIVVTINGVPAFGRQGLDLRGRNTRTAVEEIALTLSRGRNRIQVYALNEAGIESRRETFTVFYEAPEAKPDLYLIAVGAGTFADTTMDLKYADDDAADLVRHFGAGGQGYGKVHATTLVGREVTTANLRELRQRLLQTRIDDCVILFVAGHGLVDDQLNYYLAAYDTDFTDPARNSIPYDVLEELLDGIPARQKLLLIDACHADEIDKESVSLIREKQIVEGKVKFRSFDARLTSHRPGEENASELMRQLFVDLRQGTGTTVIASAGALEFALEGDAWKNGVFTYCLLNGLRTGAADRDRNGRVMVSELQQYLSTEVPRLTEGRQQPAFRIENPGNDWWVW